MGSVIEVEKCPNCKQDGCYSEYYYKTGEGWMGCQKCGYYKSAFIKRDKNSVFLKDETGELVWEEKEIENPAGAYKIKFADSIGSQIGHFENEEQIAIAEAEMLSNEKIIFISISRLIDGKIVNRIVRGVDDEKDEEEELPF